MIVPTSLLAFASAIILAASIHTADDAKRAVLDAHEQRRAATVAGDADAVGALMTDDLTFTHANAVVETKAQFVDAIASKRLEYRSITDEDHEVRVHGDTGIVSGICRIVVDASGTEIDIRVRFTELWVKKNDGWRMTLWHAVEVPPAEATDITRPGSVPSVVGPDEWFTGTVRIDPLFDRTDPARVNGASVTFEPGARTAWHTHPLGQTLIVTSGCGWAQREGGPVEEIRPGDVVWFPPGVRHWHGATATTAMTHIAIQEKLDGKAVDWMEKVTDEQYSREHESRP